jgi:hypothetical protein
MGGILRACYAGSRLYDHLMVQVEQSLKRNNELSVRNAAIAENLKKVVTIISGSLKQLHMHVSVREEARLYHEHYKAKLAKL